MQYAVIPAQLGAQIKSLRQAYRIPVADVADYMQISRSRLCRIEQNPLPIKLHQFYLLMAAIGAEVQPFPDLLTLRPLLVQARRATGLTQARFGQMVGVSQSRIARIESDPAHLSLDLFLKVLAALRVRLFIGQHVHKTPLSPLTGAMTAAAPEARPAPVEPAIAAPLRPPA
jgi:HTH-type transcriptional regulator/antitoxin HipB